MKLNFKSTYQKKRRSYFIASDFYRRIMNYN